MCSAKQVKKLVCNPEMEVFAVLATDKYLELELEGTELLSLHAFAAAHFCNCDELVNNRVHWCKGLLPAAAQSLVRNVLRVNSHEGRTAHARVY